MHYIDTAIFSSKEEISTDINFEWEPNKELSTDKQGQQ